MINAMYIFWIGASSNFTLQVRKRVDEWGWGKALNSKCDQNCFCGCSFYRAKLIPLENKSWYFDKRCSLEGLCFCVVRMVEN